MSEREGSRAEFLVSWYETVLAKMESEFDIVVAENEKLKKQLEAIKQAAMKHQSICKICKHWLADTENEPCNSCVYAAANNWQPPEVGE